MVSFLVVGLQVAHHSEFANNVHLDPLGLKWEDVHRLRTSIQLSAGAKFKAPFCRKPPPALHLLLGERTRY